VQRSAFWEGEKPGSFRSHNKTFKESHKSQDRDAGMSLLAVSNQPLQATKTPSSRCSPDARDNLRGPGHFNPSGPGSFRVT
jgi:hypothetical protein